MNTKNILTVTQITHAIKGNLEDNFSSVLVEGEVSNMALPRSGHCYMTLKDKDASIRTVAFKYVHQALKFELEDGQKIHVHGKISVYAQRGEYQLIATRIEPAGIGPLQLAFEQLKKKLEAEGLFNKENKKAIPMLPQRIGIVTSGTGAAIKDMLNVLGRRFANVSIILAPVLVQGEGAKEQIAAAIADLNELGDLDVIIVGRGGGSIEDLWAFNEEIVARAIFDSKIPVISAVGHEVDFTIADFVADLRAPTPSAAAELVIEQKDILEERVANARNRITGFVETTVEHLREKLDSLSRSYFFKQPRAMIEREQQSLDSLVESLESAATDATQAAREGLQYLLAKLDALSPSKTLIRGFSVTLNEKGGVVKSAKDVKVKDRLVTRFAKDEIVSEVLSSKT